MKNPLRNDLNHILQYTSGLWNELRNQRIFITGGTGFIGRWLLESFVWANQQLDLNSEMIVLTRNISAFFKKCPYFIKHPALVFIEGDVRNFEFPRGEFSHIIHAATDASVKLNITNPQLMFSTIVDGTQRVLDFAKSCHTKQFLLISSGAVYDKSSELTHLTEDTPCHYNNSAYASGKYLAEQLSISYLKQFSLDIKIARCFSFVGPYLPLNIHYAIGNFIRDGLQGGPIMVNGDGTPYRSYLYASDLAIWLWTILFHGQTARPYNVGSDQAISIGELAALVGHCFKPTINVNIMKSLPKNKIKEYYVPSVRRAREELGLMQCINLEDAIDSTIHWYSSNQQ